MESTVTSERLSHSPYRRRTDLTSTMDRLRTSMIGLDADILLDNDPDEFFEEPPHLSHSRPSFSRLLTAALSQVPAVVLIGMFHLMIGIPFGVSYFPVGWHGTHGSNTTTTTTNEWVDGPFPLDSGKEALGIRMFLFSTALGQVVFTACSQFVNPIALQMVENVPFGHALAARVIAQMGYGRDALATLVVMFGAVASLLVGTVFYVLGKWQLGRVVYFFPTHVLVGCIGGIGVFIAKTGLEVTMNAAITLRQIQMWWSELLVLSSNESEEGPASQSSVYHLAKLLIPVAMFELGLRLLEFVLTRDAGGKTKYPLLSPIYFCLITPVFYAALWMFQLPVDRDYFFPAIDTGNAGINSAFDNHLFDMWKIMDFSLVSWKVIFVDCMPTLIALILFSLIHVPINIPAFAISSKSDVDMNNELMAHGYSNMLSGLFGGLQNYMAYTQSVLYHRSGGTGKVSGIVVALVTTFLFVVGPTIASYIPRCMAGTLLLHVGTDLFLEGVYDSYGKYDRLEYGGIWLIVMVMTVFGMDAAMIAGAIAAVSTYAVQSITYLTPIRGSMSAVTLRSSCKTRDSRAQAILSTMRARIQVIQMQGHLFFGNVSQFTEHISNILKQELPLIVILDFSLVLSIDSSAAQAIRKLQAVMESKLGVELSIFVPGSDAGFPCEVNLSEQLSSFRKQHPDELAKEADEETQLLPNRFKGSEVVSSLDQALTFAEDALVARENPSLLSTKGMSVAHVLVKTNSSLAEEKEVAYHYLSNICPIPVDPDHFEAIFRLLERQQFLRGQYVWKQGSLGTSAKLLMRGTLVAVLENEAGTSEQIPYGNMIGELAMVQGSARMSSVKCTSEVAILYSLSKESFDQLVASQPLAARIIDMIIIEYLANRVQHVSNRIFETRCLPV